MRQLLPVLGLDVRPHELGLREDVSFHRLEKIGLGWRGKIQLRVESVQLEEVAMNSDRRAGTTVLLLAPIVRTLNRAGRKP